MRNLRIFNRLKEEARKQFLKKHGIEPCNKANCKLCKPHKVWKKYSKFKNKRLLMEDIIVKQEIIELETGTHYYIMNYEEEK